MSQLLIGPNPILVLPAYLFALDKSSSLEIGDDSLDRAFGNTNLLRDFAEHQRGIPGQKHEDVRMIREERPLQSGLLLRLCAGQRGSG